MSTLSEAKSLLDSEAEPVFFNSSSTRKKSDKRSTLGASTGQYSTRCNFSLLSNYLLYAVFITQTGVFNYYAFFYPNEDEPCYANHVYDKPLAEGAGRDITDRFNQILYIGSACGILELLRNSLNLWAKCFNHQKLAIVFSILGFITAFLFMFNFILMQLWRFEHEG